MKNKLVFSIIWTHVFVMCSFMLLILFCLFITISPWAESHPWLWLMPWQKLRGSTLWEGGVESQLLGSSATLLDPEVQRRCSGGCPSWAGSPWRIPELWAGPAWQRCRERARAAALSAAFPGHGPGGLGKAPACRERSSCCSWLCWNLLSLLWGFVERLGIGSSTDFPILQMLH